MSLIYFSISICVFHPKTKIFPTFSQCNSIILFVLGTQCWFLDPIKTKSDPKLFFGDSSIRKVISLAILMHSFCNLLEYTYTTLIDSMMFHICFVSDDHTDWEWKIFEATPRSERPTFRFSGVRNFIDFYTFSL